MLFVGTMPLWLVVAACSGGGGKKPPSNPDAAAIRERPPVAVADAPKGWETDPDVWAAHDEFRAQSGLDKVNAQGAYAKGITGKGVTIGFIDTGLDVGHHEFRDKTIRLNDRSGLDAATSGQLSHGTGVASVALGSRGSGAGMHGVAFDADPAMWSLNLKSGYLTVNDRILSRAITALEGAGARIINQSWGYSTPLNINLHQTQRDFLASQYADTLARMRQRRAIHVWAAGNSGYAQPASSAAWAVLFRDLAGFSITVAALGDDGKIGRGSNRCGAARNHCLAAPGGVAAGGSAYTILARAGGGYRTAYGTSYAAPYVSGTLALMMQAFGDQLTLPEYTARLFATADKSGVYANAEIYGQGVVDVDAALSPFGDTDIPLPTGGLAGPHESRIIEGDLPRDMIERLRREKIIILDELNTPFSAPLISESKLYQSFDMTEWMTSGDNKTAPDTHPFLNNFAAAQEGKVAAFWTFVPMVLREKSARDENPDRDGIGFTARRTRRRSRFEIGVVGQRGGLLGATGSGALRLGSSLSVLLSAGRELQLGDNKLSIDAHASYSVSRSVNESLVRGTKGALSSALMLGFQRGNFNAKIGQPTFFESGSLNLSLPYRRRADGSVVFKSHDFSLAAPQRPLEMRLLYHHKGGQWGARFEKHAGAPLRVSLGYLQRF